MEKLIPKLRFPEFREDWKQNQLKSVVSINPKVKPLPEEFIYIDLESVEKGVLLFEKKISKNDAPSRATRTLEKDDILFQTVRPYQRNNYLFIKSESNYVASTGYAQLRTQQIPKFIYQILSTDNFNNDVMNRCTGTSYPAINSTDLGDIKISYPTLQEQTKIADFLGAVDKQLDILNQKKEKLNLYKKGTMQQLFLQQIRFKDDNGNDFPDWEEIILGDEVNLKHGYQFRSNDFTQHGIAVIKIGNVIGNDLNLNNLSYISEDRLSEFKNFIIKKGDILMSLTGNIGRVIEVKHLPFEMLQNYRVGNFIPNNNKIYKKFLKYLLISDYVFGKFNNLSNQSAQANFGKQDMDKIKIGIPSVLEQTKIANFLSAIDNQIEAVEKQITKTETYKKGLLQQMFV